MEERKKIKIVGKCKMTGEMYSTDFLYEDDFDKYKKRGRISDCLPYLSADDREFLISGVSPKGWKEMYGE